MFKMILQDGRPPRYPCDRFNNKNETSYLNNNSTSAFPLLTFLKFHFKSRTAHISFCSLKLKSIVNQQNLSCHSFLLFKKITFMCAYETPNKLISYQVNENSIRHQGFMFNCNALIKLGVHKLRPSIKFMRPCT